MKRINMYAMVSVLLSVSCGKEFLEIKPDASIGTPSKISDYQALLDQSIGVINNNAAHVFSLIGADEFFLDSDVWHGIPVTNNRVQQKNAYIWADNVYEGEPGADWNWGYGRILYANMVLDGLEKIGFAVDEKPDWDNAKGTALFIRALNFYQLAQLFCKPYDEQTAAMDLGIPLRLEADVTVKSKRATIKEVYDRILRDLNEAVALLPATPLVKVRPSKAAAYGLLARIHLQMEDYNQAKQSANEALRIQDVLIDFNSLPTAIQYPFPYDYGATNEEILFFCFAPAIIMMGNARMHVDPVLLSLYNANDKRLAVYYGTGGINNVFFRGSYFGNTPFFVGPSTAEMILIRAECNARHGELSAAIADINRLGEHRYEKGSFIHYSDLGNEETLKLVLDERRRELAFRGLRWEDLRRLNKDPRFATSIVRRIGDHIYTLEPNSPKYVWPIPDEVIQLTGMEQNPRR